MYIMNLKNLFNNSISFTNVIILTLCNIVGMIIACHLFMGCCSVSAPKEGFDNMGAPLDYNMGKNVPGDTYQKPLVNSLGEMCNLYASLKDNKGGPVPPKGLFLWVDNKFKPECCYTPQQYSSSTGCACIAPDQMKYISSRGGNNTIPM